MDYFLPRALVPEFGRLFQRFAEVATPERAQRLVRAAAVRSRDIACVFESTHHSHNISAVLRTAEGLGFQDVTFVYPRIREARFRLRDSVERGASIWLSARRCETIPEAAAALARSGYKIGLVTLLETSRSVLPEALPAVDVMALEAQAALPWDPARERIALVFGNEMAGVSEEWHRFAHFTAHIPMGGFSESLNVSVCAGIMLATFRSHFERHRLPVFRLQDWERRLLLESWCARSVPEIRMLACHAGELRLENYATFLMQGGFYKPFGAP